MSDLLFDILGCEKDSLLVDYGTASKFLLIDSKLEYKGGIIGPGLKMMNASLAGTDLLDNYEIEVPKNLINQDTKNAINASSTYLEAFKIISLFNYLKNPPISSNRWASSILKSFIRNYNPLVAKY